MSRDALMELWESCHQRCCQHRYQACLWLIPTNKAVPQRARWHAYKAEIAMELRDLMAHADD